MFFTCALQISTLLKNKTEKLCLQKIDENIFPKNVSLILLLFFVVLRRIDFQEAKI